MRLCFPLTGVFTMTIPTESSFGKIQDNKPLHYDFSIDVLLNEAWKRVHGCKATYWGAVLISILVNLLTVGIFTGIVALIFYIVNGALDLEDPTLKNYFSTASNLATFLLSPLLVGIYYLGIQRISDMPIKATMIFEPFKRFLHIIGTLLLTYFSLAIIIFIGLFIFGILNAIAESRDISFLYFLSIVVGVITAIAAFYVAFGLAFAPVLVFEKKMGIITAMKASLLGFSKHWFKIFILYIIMAFLIIVSAIPIFIGYIWTIPMGINLFGILYRTIFGVEHK
jgi:hypothetical protein